MPFFFSDREPHITELMDEPDCDRQALFNTYRQFRFINSLISRWRRVYTNYIRPFALAGNRTCTILDIGFGGGDIPLKLHKWCTEDSITPRITAIDTDERAFEFVTQLETPDSIFFNLVSSSDLVTQGLKFDFVISNHLLHHLHGQALDDILEESKILSSHRVLFNDIERSDLGYLLFNLLSRPIFRSSFITHDGLASIKRSFTFHELVEKAPVGWQVKRLFPYRLLLTYLHD